MNDSYVILLACKMHCFLVPHADAASFSYYELWDAPFRCFFGHPVLSILCQSLSQNGSQGQLQAGAHRTPIAPQLLQLRITSLMSRNADIGLIAFPSLPNAFTVVPAEKLKAPRLPWPPPAGMIDSGRLFPSVPPLFLQADNAVQRASTEGLFCSFLRGSAGSLLCDAISKFKATSRAKHPFQTPPVRQMPYGTADTGVL